MNAQTTTAPPLVIYEEGHIEPPIAHLLVALVFGWVILFIVRGWKAYRAERSLLRRARQAKAHDLPMREGETLIKGRVVFAKGQTLAMRTIIEQKGSERKNNKGHWKHSWEECGRTTEAQPFYLECAGGERVRIEPSEASDFVDDTGRPEWHTRTSRSFTAELSPSEEVFIEGFLRHGDDPEHEVGASGYRQTTRGWLMTHSAEAPLKLSAEPLTKRHHWKLDRIRNGIAIGALCMLASLVLVSPFVMTLFTGRHEPGQVTRKWTYQERTKNGTRTVRKIRFKLKPRAPSTRSRHVSVRLAKSEFNGVAVGSTVVALRYRNLFGRDAYVLGSGPSVHWLALLFGSFIALGGFGALWSGMDAKRWYESKLKHSGGGRLPDFPKSSSGST